MGTFLGFFRNISDHHNSRMPLDNFLLEIFEAKFKWEYYSIRSFIQPEKKIVDAANLSALLKMGNSKWIVPLHVTEF